MAIGARPGRPSYTTLMGPADWADYNGKLATIERMEMSGELQRGWKTEVVEKIPYTFSMVSSVLTRRTVSPPVLDMIILHIGARGKSRPTTDYELLIHRAKEMLEQVSQMVDLTKQKMDQHETDYAIMRAQMDANHARAHAKLEAQHEAAQRRFGEVMGQIEEYETKIQEDYDQYGDEVEDSASMDS